ncbi:MAG: IPT/TIG domain-containing protein, partial [Roseiflexaceae bacterium]
APPAISGFTPASGPVGTQVTISGANFVGITGVSFHGVAASSFTVDSATRIHVVVPNGATSGKIGVTTVSGAATSAINFAVTSISPQVKEWVYLPLISNGAAAAAGAAKAQYTALSWDESEATNFLCSLDKR